MNNISAINLKKAITLNTVNKLITAAGGVVLISVVATKLSPEMQGFYYTFYSLVFIKFFSELGLNVATVQTIAHLTNNEDDDQAKKVASLFVRWYRIVSVILAFVLIPLILLFQEEYQKIIDYNKNIILPWILLAILTGCSVYQVGLTAVLEGNKRLYEVSKIRALTSFSSTYLIALLMIIGLELWSMPLALLLALVINHKYIKKNKTYFEFATSHNELGIKYWNKEIWPFQWRLAISWASGYFIFYFITPYLMKLHGAEVAGKMGMTLQVFMFINTLTMIVIGTKASLFGSLVAQNKIEVLDIEYKKDTWKSTILLLVLLSLVWLLYYLGKIGYDIKVVDRMVEKNELLYFTLAAFGVHGFYILSQYMRFYKNESLWLVSLLHSITTILLAVIYVPEGGMEAASIIYASTSLLYWIIVAPIFLIKNSGFKIRSHK